MEGIGYLAVGLAIIAAFAAAALTSWLAVLALLAALGIYAAAAGV